MTTNIEMKVCLILLFMIGVSVHVTCQPAGRLEKILRVDDLSLNGEARMEINRLKKELSSPSQSDELSGIRSYNLAICYVAENKPDSVFHYISETIDKTSAFNPLIFTNTDLDFLKTDPRWKRIEQRIDSVYLAENDSITHKDQALQLYHIYMADQHIRRLGLKNADPDINSSDSINLIRVQKIIQEYGWPTYSMVGEAAAKGAFLVIQHSSVSIQEKYVRHVIDAVMRKEASPEWAALMMDRIAVQKRGVQLFGTQLYQIRDSLTGAPGTWRLFPLHDESMVDSLRSALGMIPLKDYLKGFGIDYQPKNK